jgi:hypothetical protein
MIPRLWQEDKINSKTSSRWWQVIYTCIYFNKNYKEVVENLYWKEQTVGDWGPFILGHKQLLVSPTQKASHWMHVEDISSC